jgi:hypothetical protein
MTYKIGNKDYTMTPEQWTLYQDTGELPEVVVNGTKTAFSLPKWVLPVVLGVGVLALVFQKES